MVVGSGINSFQVSVFNIGMFIVLVIGVMIFGNGLINSGLICLMVGVGVQFSGNVGIVLMNSGMIQGVMIGVQISGYLINIGMIMVIGNGGIVVWFDVYGVVFNNVGGVIGNGGQVILGVLFNQLVVNVGIINGMVLFIFNFLNINNSQCYIFQGGGIFNGNFVFGVDGVLFIDFVNIGLGQFVGIIGMISVVSGVVLCYCVVGMQVVMLGLVGLFVGVIYELISGVSFILIVLSIGM